MLIGLDGRCFYGLIGRFDFFFDFILLFFYGFYFGYVFCVNIDGEMVWKEGIWKGVWCNRWMKFCIWNYIYLGYDFVM